MAMDPATMSPEELVEFMNGPATMPPPGEIPDFTRIDNRDGLATFVLTFNILIPTLFSLFYFYSRFVMSREFAHSDSKSTTKKPLSAMAMLAQTNQQYLRSCSICHHCGCTSHCLYERHDSCAKKLVLPCSSMGLQSQGVVPLYGGTSKKTSNDLSISSKA